MNDGESDRDRDPAEELREMIQRMLSGDGEMDFSALANAAGVSGADSQSIAGLMQHLQSALSNPSDEIDWSAGMKQAERVISQNPGSVSSDERDATKQAANLAALWLDEQTEVGSIGEMELLSRQQWAQATMPVWQEIAAPVATSIADALTQAMGEATPESESEMIAGAGRLLRNVGGTLFAVQLGQVVGQLAGEVLAGGDVGFPLLDDRAAVIPANLPKLTDGLEVPVDQVRIWLALREFAHARLFQHAKWLRLQVLSGIRSYAEGIHVDVRARSKTLLPKSTPRTPSSCRSSCATARSSLLAQKSRSRRSPRSRPPSRSSRAGSTASQPVPRLACRAHSRSPRRFVADARPAGRPRRRSPPSSASSFAPVGCARPASSGRR